MVAQRAVEGWWGRKTECHSLRLPPHRTYLVIACAVAFRVSFCWPVDWRLYFYVLPTMLNGISEVVRVWSFGRIADIRSRESRQYHLLLPKEHSLMSPMTQAEASNGRCLEHGWDPGFLSHLFVFASPQRLQPSLMTRWTRVHNVHLATSLPMFSLCQTGLAQRIFCHLAW